MRDGICWDAGHVGICRDMRGYAGYAGYAEYAEYAGICGICGDMRGYAGICGTDHLPEIGPAVLPFLAPSPPNPQRAANGSGK